MPFLWIEIADALGAVSDRAYLEGNSIVLLSNFGKEPHRQTLGRLDRAALATGDDPKIWVVEHKSCEYEYTPAFFGILEEYVAVAK